MFVHSISTNDVDEAVDLTSHVYYAHRVAPVRPGDQFRFDLRAMQTPTMTAGLLRYGCEVDIEIGHPDTSYTVGIPIRGAVDTVQTGSEEVQATPTRATVWQPGTELKMHGYQTGSESALVLTFNRTALESELRQMLGRDVDESIRFELPLELGRGPGAEWWRLVQALVPALTEMQGPLLNPLVGPQLSSTVMRGLLLAARHQHRDALDAPSRPECPAVIQRAASIIEDRAAEPLSVSGIAAEVGCSVRALQVGFRRHLGTTPGSHLARVRLERAHAQLQASTRDVVTVSEVAAGWGFTHLGRFAGAYRHRYGVAPSTTLRGS